MWSSVLRTLLASVILTALTTPSKPVTDPVLRSQLASWQIGQQTVTGWTKCSATAVGPHALLTSSHCEQPSDDLFIRGVDEGMTIKFRLRDGQDHTIYLISGHEFNYFVPVDLSGSLTLGDHVFTWGNPGDWQDVFQAGYLAGIERDRSLVAALGGGKPDTLLFTVQAYKGSSGSGVFNPAGVLVAVISFDEVQQDGDVNGERISFASAYQLGFKPADLDRARSW